MSSDNTLFFSIFFFSCLPVFAETRLVFRTGRRGDAHICCGSKLVWRVKYSAVLHFRKGGSCSTFFFSPTFPSYIQDPSCVYRSDRRSREREREGDKGKKKDLVLKAQRHERSTNTFGDDGCEMNMQHIRQLPQAAC